MDLLFDLTGRDGPSIVGAMTEAIVSTPSDRVALLGVRFRPGEAFAFLQGDARSMRDARVSLDAAWGSFAESLRQRLLEARSTSTRIGLLESELLRRRRCAGDGRVRQVVELLRRAHGGLRVAEAARRVGVGERQLERLFDERVGVGPKRLGAIFRVQALSARAAASADWAGLASELGWSDQAHLTRDVGRIAGITPSQLGRALRMNHVSSKPLADEMSDSFNPARGPLPILWP
jgi:AraC-like DNA-binding protein